MQIGRMFETVYLLMDKKNITAKELAEHFDVSVRTVYRDIEALSMAGIPIYACKGTGGGIRLTDSFVLNKSVLTQKERQGIMASLGGMSAVKIDEADAALKKLSALFGGERADWIEIDFSSWGATQQARQAFSLLKEAILARRVVTFFYSSARQAGLERITEPVRLVFKDRAWYLLAWCRLRKDYRYFKLSRIAKISMTSETFSPRAVPPPVSLEAGQNIPVVSVSVLIDAEMEYRVRDEFDERNVRRGRNNSFEVTFEMPEGDWLYQYLMTFGEHISVLSPDGVREKMREKLKKACERYSI